MIPAEAAWVRANAWTAAMREIDASYPTHRGCFLYRISPCQMGRCGACDMGRCDRCTTTTRGSEPFGWDVGVVLDGRTVAHLYPVDGQRCRGWVCSCDCRNVAPPTPSEITAPANPAPRRGPTTKPRPVPAHASGPASIPGQLDLWEVA